MDPGGVSFASSGNGFLVVNRGARLHAEGTATSPIVFTARANVVGTATDTSQGLWGGIVLPGRAPISAWLSGAVGGSANRPPNNDSAPNALSVGATASSDERRVVKEGVNQSSTGKYSSN